MKTKRPEHTPAKSLDTYDRDYLIKLAKDAISGCPEAGKQLGYNILTLIPEPRKNPEMPADNRAELMSLGHQIAELKATAVTPGPESLERDRAAEACRARQEELSGKTFLEAIYQLCRRIEAGDSQGRKVDYQVNRKYARVYWCDQDGNPESLVVWVELATGLLYTGSWKQPTRNFPRGSVYED